MSLANFSFNLKSRILRGVCHRPRFQNTSQSILIEIGDPRFHTFFGYYDLCPFDAQHPTLLCIKTKRKRKYTRNSEAEIGLYDLASQKFLDFGVKTRAWNWQMGARQQWWDGNSVIFNDAQNDRYVSKIAGIKTSKIIKTFDHCFFDISKDRQWGIHLDFDRLEAMRPGYGYVHSLGSDPHLKVINLQSGEIALYLNPDDMKSFFNDLGPYDTLYFNHASWSPDSTHFFVLIIAQGDKGRNGYGLIVSREGIVQKIPGLHKVSHYAWQDSNHLLLSAHDEKGFGFFMVDTSKNIVSRFLPDILMEDGHPSFHPSAPDQWLLCDRYRDRYSEQMVFLTDLRAQKMIELGRFFRPYGYVKDNKCDLHPRFSADGRWVCVDSAHAGYRQIVVMQPKDLL